MSHAENRRRASLTENDTRQNVTLNGVTPNPEGRNSTAPAASEPSPAVAEARVTASAPQAAEPLLDNAMLNDAMPGASPRFAAPDFAGNDFAGNDDFDSEPDDNGALTLEAIDHAIAAHGRWNIRLRCAIETGRTVFTPETTQAEKCPMGALLSPTSVRHQTIREIHDDFHREVGRILTLAVRGRREEARAELEINPDFAMVSAAFTGQLKSLAREITLAESPELLDSYR